MVTSKVASFEANFSRIVDSSKAGTSVTGKAECLLAISEGKSLSTQIWGEKLRIKS